MILGHGHLIDAEKRSTFGDEHQLLVKSISLPALLQATTEVKRT